MNVVNRNKELRKNANFQKPKPFSAMIVRPNINLTGNWKNNDNVMNQEETRLQSKYTRQDTSSSTSSSTNRKQRQQHTILAVTEGRGNARCEVGIACISVESPILVLCQFSDTQRYNFTLTKINALNPTEILFPSTFVDCHNGSSGARIYQLVQSRFPNLPIKTLARSDFNSEIGLSRLQHICSQSSQAVLFPLKHRFYALSAASALLSYVNHTFRVFYIKKSIRVQVEDPENVTIIDITTADKLELVSCNNGLNQSRSLLSILNHCKTLIGGRSLRASLLQPLSSETTITNRLACVEELLENPDLHKELQAKLVLIADVHRLLTLAMVMPQQDPQVPETQLNLVLIVKTVLDTIGPLIEILGNLQQPFFKNVVENLRKFPTAEISNMVRAVIHDDAHLAKGQAGMLQRCFAIKQELNGLLDVARRIYSELVEDAREYVKQLSAEFSMPFRMNHTFQRGYHIVLSLKAAQRSMTKSDLPDFFIQIQRTPAAFALSTVKMVDFNMRIESCVKEIQTMSNIIIYKLLIDLRVHVDHFYQLCDDVAQLDVVQSLTQASRISGYVCPKFASVMDLKDSRHPMLDFTCRSAPVANDIFSSEERNLHLITGPNMAGKSVYIKQIILLQIMAQVGCFVPASSATFRIADKIFSRIGSDDDLDANASSFIVELRQLAHILNSLTDRSLVVIDEMCISTSWDEGLCLAWAICEHLMQKKAFIFVATHYLYLAKMTELHSNVRVLQMEATEDMRCDRLNLNYTHKLKEGVTIVENYGIRLAKICNFTKTILKEAEVTAEMLKNEGISYHPAEELENHFDYLSEGSKDLPVVCENEEEISDEDERSIATEDIDSNISLASYLEVDVQSSDSPLDLNTTPPCSSVIPKTTSASDESAFLKPLELNLVKVSTPILPVKKITSSTSTSSSSNRIDLRLAVLKKRQTLTTTVSSSSDTAGKKSTNAKSQNLSEYTNEREDEGCLPPGQKGWQQQRMTTTTTRTTTVTMTSRDVAIPSAGGFLLPVVDKAAMVTCATAQRQSNGHISVSNKDGKRKQKHKPIIESPLPSCYSDFVFDITDESSNYTGCLDTPRKQVNTTQGGVNMVATPYGLKSLEVTNDLETYFAKINLNRDASGSGGAFSSKINATSPFLTDKIETVDLSTKENESGYLSTKRRETGHCFPQIYETGHFSTRRNGPEDFSAKRNEAGRCLTNRYKTDEFATKRMQTGDLSTSGNETSGFMTKVNRTGDWFSKRYETDDLLTNVTSQPSSFSTRNRMETSSLMPKNTDFAKKINDNNDFPVKKPMTAFSSSLSPPAKKVKQNPTKTSIINSIFDESETNYEQSLLSSAPSNRLILPSKSSQCSSSSSCSNSISSCILKRKNELVLPQKQPQKKSSILKEDENEANFLFDISEERAICSQSLADLVKKYTGESRGFMNSEPEVEDDQRSLASTIILNRWQ